VPLCRANPYRRPPLVCIVDYGMGNVGSVREALAMLGARPCISAEDPVLSVADGIVLPGVGAFGEAMENLRRQNLIGCLSHHVLERRTPLLGICLGMQLLAEGSEEMGRHAGLGWIRGHVVRLPEDRVERIPHVGWSLVRPRGEEALFRRVPPDSCFYFDHSYYLVEADPAVVASAENGVSVAAAIRSGPVMGTQFHPEKSQRNGLKLLRNFLDICVESRRARL
jgi:glutamine amidotransferase